MACALSDSPIKAQSSCPYAFQESVLTVPLHRLPSPSRSRIVNTARFIAEPLRALESWARLGGRVHIPLVGMELLFLSDPDDIGEVLLDKEGVLIKDELTRALSRVLGAGLLTSDGPHWRKHRQLVAHAFTPRRIGTYAEMMSRRARSFSERLPIDRPFDLHAAMAELAMEIVAETLFGAEVSSDTRKVGAALDIINEYFARSPESILQLPLTIPTPRTLRLRGAIADIEAVLERFVRERADDDAGADLLSALLSARLSTHSGSGDEGGGKLSPEGLRDETVTLFLAGHETTALTLAHALYLLATHPIERMRLEEEVDRVLGGRMATLEDLSALEYTERVIRETMRLYPTAWSIGRENPREATIAGVALPPRTQIVLSQWVTHRDDRFYQAPGQFKPSRWSEEFKRELPRYAYFPFGGGARVCIGNRFAEQEAVLALASIIARHRIHLEGSPRLSFSPSVTLRPSKNLMARAERRV